MSILLPVAIIFGILMYASAEAGDIPEPEPEVILPEKPDAPHYLNISSLDIDNIHLLWDEPNYHRAAISKYELMGKKLTGVSAQDSNNNNDDDGDDSYTLMYAGRDHDDITIDHLEPATTYRFHVRAWNSMGHGNYSSYVDIRTKDPTVPSAPMPVSLHKTGRLMLKLEWAAPVAHGSPITGYQLQMNKHKVDNDTVSSLKRYNAVHSTTTDARDSETSSAIFEDSKFLRADDKDWKDVYSGEKLAYTANYLWPNSYYSFRVRALVSAEELNRNKAEEDINIHPVSSWSYVSYYHTDGFLIKKPDAPTDLRSVPVETPADKKQKKSDEGNGDDEDDEGITDTSIHLQWADPENDNACEVVSYIVLQFDNVEAGADVSALQPTKTYNVSRQFHLLPSTPAQLYRRAKAEPVAKRYGATQLITELTASTQYAFQVVAVNHVGASVPSDVFRVSTHATAPPPAPPAPFLAEVASESITVQWSNKIAGEGEDGDNRNDDAERHDDGTLMYELQSKDWWVDGPWVTIYTGTDNTFKHEGFVLPDISYAYRLRRSDPSALEGFSEDAPASNGDWSKWSKTASFRSNSKMNCGNEADLLVYKNNRGKAKEYVQNCFLATVASSDDETIKCIRGKVSCLFTLPPTRRPRTKVFKLK